MKKQKKFGRKLQLNKETISKLSADHTRELVGGATVWCSYDCPSLKATKCDLTECLVCPCEYPITPPPTFLC